MGIPIPTNGNFGNDTTQSQAFSDWSLPLGVSGCRHRRLSGHRPYSDATGSVRPPETGGGAGSRPTEAAVVGVAVRLHLVKPGITTARRRILLAPLEPGIWAGATYLLTSVGVRFDGGLGSVFCNRATPRGSGSVPTFLGVRLPVRIIFNRPVFDYHDPQVFVPTARFRRTPSAHGLRSLWKLSPADPIASQARMLEFGKPLSSRWQCVLATKQRWRRYSSSFKKARKARMAKSFQIYDRPDRPAGGRKENGFFGASHGSRRDRNQTSLGISLKQLDLGFAVKDGLLLITAQESVDLYTVPYDDPFQIVGHCLLALIAAGFGGVGAPLMCDLARRPRE